MLTNLVPNQNSWIPVSGHWDDTLLIDNVRTVVDSFAVSHPLTRSGMTVVRVAVIPVPRLLGSRKLNFK
ncbi:WPE palindromic element domain-containing protein [Wolbachia endosymbiont of Dactylopius coccus]